ncbi:MAG: hypothetical protein L3J56_02145 [Bacteroidales bacterium]|nr:hypothetical protein [Bacteroidales bacterium]
MERIFTKIYLILAIYLGFNTFSYSQENVLIYANDNYWSAFVLNFNTNRYCYSFAKDAMVGGMPVYSRGNFIKKGDTIIVKSDYDNMKLPFDVKSKNKPEIKYNEIVFNFLRIDPFNDNGYELERNNLFFIVNGVDTIRLYKDTIKYNKKIENFQIASIERVKFLYAEYYDDIPNDSYEEFIYYKTKIYNVIDTCNYFEVTFCINRMYVVYKPLNDTIVFNKSKAIWYLSNKKAHVNLKKTSLNKVQRIIDSCECWDKKGMLNLKVDIPNCSEINNK